MGIFKLNGIDYMGGGGGGNTNEQVLTWAEYCALTEEEKANSTTYYINDINGKGKDEFQPVIYSTEEREIGVWTDGKPLYQRVFELNSTITINSGGQNIKTLITNPPTIETIISAQAINNAGGTDAIYMDLVNDQYRCYCADQINYVKYVICKYTKTTDQPGSGTWTPQGVPTVHYSTDEQVVGTWVDGSTIYEKTITGTLGNTSQKTIDLSSEINCNLVIDIKGWIMSTDSSNNYQIWMHDAYVRYYLRNNSLIIDKNGADNYGWDNPYTFIIRYTKTT